MKRNFPSFIEAFLEYSKNVGSPEKFLIWSAISAVAGALERKTWVVYNGIQSIYPNCYIMLVADSGIAKKSTATRPIMEIIEGVEGIKQMTTQLSAAALIKQLEVAGATKTFDFGGTKYRNSSVFSYSSEASSTIGDKSGLEGVQVLLTDLYDCGKTSTWSNKPAWDKETISGGKVDIFNPCLNMLACSNPEWLNQCIGKNGIKGGFASRVLFVNQKEMVETSGWLEEDEITHKSGEYKQKLIEDLNSINQLSGIYKPLKGWKNAYNAIEKDVNAKIREGGNMTPYYSRKMWHLLKLAQILAADRSNEMVLSCDHLDYAKELLETIEPDMYSSFQIQGENKSLLSFKHTWEVLRRKKKWSKTEMTRAVYQHANVNQLNEHLQSLVAMNKMIYIPAETKYAVIDPSPL